MTLSFEWQDAGGVGQYPRDLSYRDVQAEAVPRVGDEVDIGLKSGNITVLVRRVKHCFHSVEAQHGSHSSIIVYVVPANR